MDEREAKRRTLAAGQLLAVQHGLECPPELQAVSGKPWERREQHQTALTHFLEVLALEGVQSGLGLKLAAVGYTDLSLLRATSDEDLEAVDGIGKATLKALRKALDQAVEIELVVDEGPPSSEFIAEDGPPLEFGIEELSAGGDEAEADGEEEDS